MELLNRESTIATGSLAESEPSESPVEQCFRGTKPWISIMARRIPTTEILEVKCANDAQPTKVILAADASHAASMRQTSVRAMAGRNC